MIQFKSIRLYPSDFYLHSYYLTTGDNERLKEIFTKKYGPDKQEYEDLINGYCCVTDLQPAKSGEDDKHRIILILYEKTPHIIAHEIVHVLFRMERIIGTEINYDSQEWQALMTDYLFREISSFKTYEKL